jgi:hypothetical protein
MLKCSNGNTPLNTPFHPILHCIDGWEDWSMPGNSLARLQMPPAHPLENSDPDSEFNICNL